MVELLNGAAAMACLAVGTFFLRFYRESDDRMFPFLAVGFWIFAVNYTALALLPLADDRRTYAFGLRLIGFLAILAGVILKNREVADHLPVARRKPQ
jgi:uncharacterized protein (TIGR04206 family)